MSALLEALDNPLNTFVRHALAAGLLASITFGIVGTYVVTKRIASIAGAIAHSALGGIGTAIYAQNELGYAWATPMFGALVFALGSALLIGAVVLSRSEREDTVIGATWAVGMAVGYLLLKKTRSGGGSVESWLFGDINFVGAPDLWAVGALGAGVVLLALLFHKQFVAVCFDEEFARARGVNVPLFYLLLLCMAAVSVVLLVRLVGIILVLALLTLPAATASRFARGLPGMMAIASLLCAAAVVAGMELSWRWNTVAGPTVILVAAALYFAVLLGGRLRARRAGRGAGGLPAR